MKYESIYIQNYIGVVDKFTLEFNSGSYYVGYIGKTLTASCERTRK